MIRILVLSNSPGSSGDRLINLTKKFKVGTDSRYFHYSVKLTKKQMVESPIQSYAVPPSDTAKRTSGIRIYN